MPWAYPIGGIHFRRRAGRLLLLVLADDAARRRPCRRLSVEILRRTAAISAVHFALLNMISLSFLLVYTGEEVVTFLFGWDCCARRLAIGDLGLHQSESAFRRVQLSGVDAPWADLPDRRGDDFHTHSQSWYLKDFGSWMSSHPGTLRNVVFLLLVTSFGLKSAFFPFHSWLPRAHAAQAPAHVSALMSGVIPPRPGSTPCCAFVASGKPDEWMGWFQVLQWC